jgi:hypothetical protein
MKSFRMFLLAPVTVLVLGSLAMTPAADAAGNRDRGGGGGGGGGRQTAQVNNSKADARASNTRSSSVNNVNNVNVNKNVNVNVDGGGGCCNNNGWDNDHPVARAAVVVGATSAIVGSMTRTVPANCVPVNYGGIVYQQCGGTWYQPQGSQFVVVNPPY